MQSGFSLMEVIITIFIIGALAAIFAAALNLARLTRDSKFQDIALRVASQQLESERALGYASTTSGSFSDPLLALLPAGTATTTISAYNAKTKQVTVTVTWDGGASSTRSQSLTTLITQVGGL
jgi:prepilin-type N-terminal cleavage/methylation domain-containing protein